MMTMSLLVQLIVWKDSSLTVAYYVLSVTLNCSVTDSLWVIAGGRSSRHCHHQVACPSKSVAATFAIHIAAQNGNRCCIGGHPVQMQSQVRLAGSATWLGTVGGCPKSTWVVLGWVGMGNVAKQTQLSCHYSRSDWRLIVSAPYFVGHAVYVWNSENAVEATLVKCIEVSAVDWSHAPCVCTIQE